MKLNYAKWIGIEGMMSKFVDFSKLTALIIIITVHFAIIWQTDWDPSDSIIEYRIWLWFLDHLIISMNYERSYPHPEWFELSGLDLAVHIKLYLDWQRFETGLSGIVGIVAY